jgi:hypothetical protein
MVLPEQKESTRPWHSLSTHCTTALATEIIGGSGKIIDFNATAVRQAGGGMIQSADDGGDGL